MLYFVHCYMYFKKKRIQNNCRKILRLRDSTRVIFILSVLNFNTYWGTMLSYRNILHCTALLVVYHLLCSSISRRKELFIVPINSLIHVVSVQRCALNTFKTISNCKWPIFVSVLSFSVLLHGKLTCILLLCDWTSSALFC